MKAIIDDLFKTVERLSKELEERTAFEHKLIETITMKDEEIAKLKESLSVYENSEKVEELKEDLKAEQFLDKALNTKSNYFVEPKDLTKDVVM